MTVKNLQVNIMALRMQKAIIHMSGKRGEGACWFSDRILLIIRRRERNRKELPKDLKVKK